MFKPALSILFISALTFNSCDSKKEESKKEEDKKEEANLETETSQHKIKANSLADISISGMVSEVNCVGSVKKLLSAMIGVTEIEIDFQSATEINHAKVKFDNTKINDQEMVMAIEKLNDGAYRVEEVEVKKLNEKSVICKKKSEEKDMTATQSSSGSAGFALPNILDVFNIL